MPTSLTENGTVTEAAVATGAELKGYSGFSDGTNWLRVGNDPDFDLGTGDLTWVGWLKSDGSVSGNGNQVMYQNDVTSAGAASGLIVYYWNANDALTVFIGGNQQTDVLGAELDDGNWHMVAVSRTGGEWVAYFDGVPRLKWTSSADLTVVSSIVTITFTSSARSTWTKRRIR